MKRALGLLVPVVALGLLPAAPARAQQPPPAAPPAAPAVTAAPVDPAHHALDEGRFADADRLATQAMAAGGAQRLVALALKARVLAAQGKVDAGIALLDPQKSAQGVGGRRVRLELGELLIRAGRRAEAEPVLMEFANEYGSDAINASDPEGLAMVGRAMHLLRHPKDANTAFKESVRADKARVETHLWWAELFEDYFDPGDAEAELNEALKLAPKNADALAMMARLKLDETFDFEAAEKLVKEALATNPKHTGAFGVRAGCALRDGDIDAANAAIDAGLAVDPSDLELLSLRAATRYLADDRPGFEAAKKAVFARNKEYSRAYGIIGDYAEWEHRYDEVIGMMKDAVALDPKDGKAWAQLGMWQTRAGLEPEGVKSLEEWWKHDHFNVRAYNTLEKLYTQWIPGMYESKTEGQFDIRYPKAERAVLERYAPRMLGEAWGQMKVHYMFTPTVPVHVEMYSSRDHFSVRTSGLPNIGIQGVCFGHVVAAMSPSSEPFNWGNVLWHELGHVFAIQISKNHVPRWFTEGLSEYETMIRRPEWRRSLDPELYSALKKNALPGAVEMNRVFTHAEGDLDVTVAYYAASQMIAFTAEQFGFAKITRALELWGEGKRTPAVLREAFGVEPQEYDARYKAWQTARLSRFQGQYMFDMKPKPLDEAKAAVAAAPKSAEAHDALALSLLRAHKGDDAGQELDAALKLDPNDKNAHFLSAKLATMTKDSAGQEKHLQAIRAAGGDGYTVELGLAETAEARKDKAAMRAALQAAHRFDPTQPEPVKALFELATEEKRDADALGALRELARLDQHDGRAWKLLLDKLVEAKAWDEAKKVGEGALFVDVQSADVHTGYARALAATGDHETAAFELESALLCQAKAPEKATAHALLAREKLALGDAAGAKAERDEAVKLDPENAEAKGLKL
jgi:tetratricopeptide (TPR) repeat protein